MPEFRIRYTGDYLDTHGNISVGDIALDIYKVAPWISFEYLRHQQPQPNDANYWQRVYSLQIRPSDLCEANGIVIFRPWLKAESFAEGAENLVAIGRAGAGYDKIDIDACTENDVVVFNAPDTLTHATASSAFLLMLALAKRLPEQQDIVLQGRWDLQTSTMGDDLPGKTLGIVGLGRSGVELAKLVQPFRMNVLAYSPSADRGEAQALGVTMVDDLRNLFERSDIVSLHCRLTPERHGMIQEEHLRLLRPTAYFVNVARGELVDQLALVRCLEEKSFAGAGLDVFAIEPLPADDPLTKLNNVILTPHWLPSTKQAARLTMECMSRGMLAVSQGQLPNNVVNREVMERPGFRRKLAHYEQNLSSRT